MVDIVTCQLLVDTLVIVTVETTATTVVLCVFCNKTRKPHIQT